jgi:ADP-ribosylglycohydrolase
MTPETAADLIRQVGVQPDYINNWEGISPFVTASVLWSLYSFLRSPDDYWDAISTAIAVGGDVDTTAAMTGAIAGTRVGLTGIPTEAALLLTDQGSWRYDDLVLLAHNLHALHEDING